MIVEVLAAFLCCALYQKWWNDFSWRFPRFSDKSPSNGLLPALRELPFARRRSSRKVMVAPLVEEGEETAQGATKNDAPDEHRKEEEASIRRRLGSFRRNRSKVLNMDHIFLSFTSFCAAHVLVYPWVIAYAGYGLALLSLRVFLFRGGWVQPKKHDPAEVAAKIILEQPMVIFYRGLRSEEHGGGIAIFCWDNISYFSNLGDEKEGNLVLARKLTVEVDLKRKRVVTGNLDGEMLTPPQLIILLHWVVIQSHVAVHGMANWAVNLEAKNSEVRWYGTVTVAYNYFGYNGFGPGEPWYRFFGLLSPGNTLKAVGKFFRHGAQESVPAHADVVELMAHSELVTFVEKLRTPFLRAFSRYKDTDFAGCDGEALFVGTVIHSLDHSQMVEAVTDPLWHDVDDPKFGYTAEIIRISHVAFSDDLPFLLFNKSFRNAKHPFYQEVYKAARKINPKLADKLDTCIAN